LTIDSEKQSSYLLIEAYGIAYASYINYLIVNNYRTADEKGIGSNYRNAKPI
jgi:hypothetical protein